MRRSLRRQIVEKPVELTKDVEGVHERPRVVVQPATGTADARDVRRAADVLEVKGRAVDVLEHERGKLRKRRDDARADSGLCRDDRVLDLEVGRDAEKHVADVPAQDPDDVALTVDIGSVG